MLLRNQLAALWTPRQMLSVQGGATYSGGAFTVEIGELRALREAQGGGISSPGVVVCISTTAGGEEEQDEGTTNGVQHAAGEEADFEFAQATIRNLWGKLREGQDLGRAEVREVLMAPKVEGRRGTEDAMVQMWCDVLKLRG